MQPQVILIDHRVGTVTVVGGDSRSKAELAWTLMERAQALKPAAVGTPPPRDGGGE